MQNTQMKIEAVVDRTFDSAWDRKCRMRTNWFTGGTFLIGLDSERQQRKLAHEFVEKQIEVEIYYEALDIAGLPAFPWCRAEREALKGTNLLSHIVALYARSLECCKYDLSKHPSFPVYASGVLAEPWLAELFSKRYPGQGVLFEPKVLLGIDASGYFNPKGRNVRDLGLTSHGTAKP